MKFLSDENVFPKITFHLRSLGHDVKSIQEEGLNRITDDEIVRLAKKDGRTIITFDKHFGNVLKYPPSSTAGIIHIRIHPPLLKDLLLAIDNLFKKYSYPSFHGKLIVLSKTGYRIR
ncbi:MAG: DUF5615 family PIN-like protein [Elusimicrobiota bacterium]